MAVGPRRITDGDAPGLPLAATICAPGTLPASCASGFGAGTFISFVSMRATENGSLSWDVAPVTPVVTTASRRLMSCASEKFAVVDPALRATGELRGTKPIARTRTVAVPPESLAAGIVIV